MIGYSASSRSRTWTRDYPPLLAVGAGLLIVLAVLPSSLNLPQSNPGETLEYAPVPPDDAENHRPRAIFHPSGSARALRSPRTPA